MIILDTNIVSEIMNPKPHPAVEAWAAGQDRQALVTTAITSAEIHYGIFSLPDGQRKRRLQATFQTMLSEDFADILPFDQAASEAYGVLSARLKALGRPVGQSDTMIAAIVYHHQATLVTRNIRHFEACGIDLVNPFDFSG